MRESASGEVETSALGLPSGLAEAVVLVLPSELVEAAELALSSWQAEVEGPAHGLVEASVGKLAFRMAGAASLWLKSGHATIAAGKLASEEAEAFILGRLMLQLWLSCC